jgi:tetratricopeptide (TPR) repeat protein
MRASGPSIVLALLPLFGCASTSALEQSQAYFARADYYRAYLEAERARQAQPGDPAIEAHYWSMRLWLHLEQGQELVFREREQEGLEELEKALVIEPENQIARRWIDKAKAKLAERAARDGDEAVTKDDLETALLRYNDALIYVPRHPAAMAGLQKVDTAFRKKRDKAYDSYLEGVRALAERLFAQTEYYSSIALRNDPALDQARSNRDRASERLAEARFARCKELEKSGHYGAALKEYEDIATVLPGYEDIESRIETMRAEVEAEALFRSGEIKVMTKSFKEGRELLQKAFERSKLQRQAIGELLALTKEREFEVRHQQAKDLELQRDLEGALAAFEKIEVEWPGFLDVRTRISGLKSAIDLGKKSLAAGEAAEKAGDLKAAIDHYTDVLLYWPGYPGLEARLRELKAKLQTKG